MQDNEETRTQDLGLDVELERATGVKFVPLGTNPPTITLSPACDETGGVHSACTWELCECPCHR